MKIFETRSLSEACKVVENVKSDCLVAHIADNPCVLTGQLPTYRANECIKRGLEVGKAFYLGGTIVCMKDDLSLCAMTYGNCDFGKNVTEFVRDWLRYELSLNVTQDKNDILIDGKKVISWARATNKEGWCQNVVHFSVGETDLNLIESICSKPINKIPGALLEYSLTSKTIYEKIMEEGADYYV